MVVKIKEKLKSTDLKVGMKITKGELRSVYTVNEITDVIKISRTDGPIVGFPAYLFNSENWYLCEEVEDNVVKDKKKPTLVSVSSSNIDAIGYDSGSMDLYVQFKGGSIYCYSNVPKKTHDQLMESDSKGSAFSSLIKGKYQYHKL